MMSFFGNSNLVVALSTGLFVLLIIYLKVPGKVAGMLDARADRIRNELEEARRLREEAQTLLASYERKQKEVEDQAQQIVANAKAEAEHAAVQAKADLEKSIARRLKAANDQIASAEASALKEVRDRAVSIAVKAAGEVIAKQMTAKSGGALIDDAIKEVGEKLH
jgi:F-type H+-transporting ATPase subunit b